MTTKAIHGAKKRVQMTPDEVKKTGEVAKWYRENINIPAGAQTLLEQYSGFAPDEVVPHVKDLVRSTRITSVTDLSSTDFPSVANGLRVIA